MNILAAYLLFLISLSLSPSVFSYEATDLQALIDTNLCRSCDLQNSDLRELNLDSAEVQKADLSRANLARAKLRDAVLRNANLDHTNLTEADLTEARLASASLRKSSLKNAILYRANLTHSDLTEADLTGADISETEIIGANLTKATLIDSNLKGANLSMSNLSGANLSGANLSGAYLYGAIMVGADLRGVNFQGAKFSGLNLTEANLEGANLGFGKLEFTGWKPTVKQIAITELGEYEGITSFDLQGDAHYLSARSGKLYLLSQGHGKVVLDVSKEQKLLNEDEVGFLSVVEQNNFLYLSYVIQENEDDDSIFLVVDEYSRALKRIRRVVKIRTGSSSHVAGTLGVDSFGKLYLSVGEGLESQNHPQNLQSMLGKILRLDVSNAKPKLEIVAYGLRNPWKFSIDTLDRMFIGDVGSQFVESVYLLDDLYPESPYNLGWPIFEGTRRRVNNSLTLDDIVSPIFEYRHESRLGISVIGGFYLDDVALYVFGDFLGNIRLLKRELDNSWNEIYFQKTENMIWSFGYDQIAKKLYMSGDGKIFNIELLNKTYNRFSSVIFCDTTMPDGSLNDTGCK